MYEQKKKNENECMCGEAKKFFKIPHAEEKEKTIKDKESTLYHPAPFSATS